MNKTHLILLSCLCVLTAPLRSLETPVTETKQSSKPAPIEETVVTKHSTMIDGKKIDYKATVGTQFIIDEKGNSTASIFYIAYTKDDVDDISKRPVTFCFNGGPGSSSVWLHLGAFGPKRININDEGTQASPPYHLVENPYSLLDITDLVFIDPVSTGFSRAINGQDPKQFHGFESDIQSVAEFIRVYTTRNLRWESPKYLAGESYGTTRAAGLAKALHDGSYLYVDGIILISSVLDFQTIKFVPGNDLPYILFLPTYTSTALYHNKLDKALQSNPKKTMDEVQQFAFGEYTQALMQGNLLDSNKQQLIIEKLSKYTGLSKEYISNANLRVNMFRFAKELLRTERRTVGRFDSRIKGIDSDSCGENFEHDPSLELVLGIFTATFNNYVRAELNWKTDDEYQILTDVKPWDYSVATNQYLNVAEKLREVMSTDNNMRVFVASGNYDLAIPYSATDYTFAHLGLDPTLQSNIVTKQYEGGHMMFLYHPTLVKLKGDISQFINKPARN